MSNLKSQGSDVEIESSVLYGSLVKVLSSPLVLEVEILPSSFPHPASSPLLIDGPALALSKKTLVKAFLVARSILLSHLASPRLDYIKSLAALESTFVILLFDPNHITAANFRKRQLLASRLSDCYAQPCRFSAQRELTFIESLITSPLVKHTKSSTLWTQRLWVVRSFPSSIVETGAYNRHCVKKSHIEAFWTKEISIVMKAGDRHPKNYYAWHYARRLYYLLTRNTALSEGTIRYDTGEYLAAIVLGQVHKWCLQHPRDISGWAFLIFLFDISLLKEDDGIDRHQLEMLIDETRRFARKYDWSGQSMDWALKAMARYDVSTKSVTRKTVSMSCLAPAI